MREKFQIYMTAQASNDLIEINEYIETDSPQNARLVLDRIDDAIKSLKSPPQLGRPHIPSNNPARVVYSILVSSFIIYYRLKEADKLIEIIAIRRGSRRQPRRFR